MNSEAFERVFGRGRMQIPSGDHVEVVREAAPIGEQRRYTKRFLATATGDFRVWSENEWRHLARLAGHGVRRVPEIVRLEREPGGGAHLVQTADAGVTVEQWATMLPVTRDGRRFGHVFEDCAHWWALALHCLLALHEIHRIGLVHLDFKPANLCIPLAPLDFDPRTFGRRLYPAFGELAVIDFAFSVVTGEPPPAALPIARDEAADYQSPRLLRALAAGRQGQLQATQELDWRCDLFSLAVMLEGFLPAMAAVVVPERGDGWTAPRYRQARELLRRLRAAHDGWAPRPHRRLAGMCAGLLRDWPLLRSLERGWTLAQEASAGRGTPTPVTRIARPPRDAVPAAGDNVADVAAKSWWQFARQKSADLAEILLTRRG